jgi:hypothetical protein
LSSLLLVVGSKAALIAVARQAEAQVGRTVRVLLLLLLLLLLVVVVVAVHLPIYGMMFPRQD